MENKIAVVEKSELSKVHANLLNADQLGFLMQKTRKDNTYTRPAKGGGTWTYVTGSYIKKVLNLMFGWDWDFEIIEHKFDLQIKQAYVLGKLKVRTGGKEIVKMQFGRVDIKFKVDWVDDGKGTNTKKKQSTDLPLDIGNDLKAAATDCLKKCASELGIASDIYAPNEFKEISVVDSAPPIDKDVERIISFISEANTVDDLSFIQGEVQDEQKDLFVLKWISLSCNKLVLEKIRKEVNESTLPEFKAKSKILK